MAAIPHPSPRRLERISVQYRPVRRRLLNLLTLASLLLCVAASVMWARSYSHLDLVGRRTVAATAGGRWMDEQFRGVVSADGGLVVLSTKRRANLDSSRADGPPTPRPGGRLEWRVDPGGWELGYAKVSDPLLGFESAYKVNWSSDTTILHDEWRWLRAPYGSLVAVAALLPLYSLLTSLRRRARRRDDRVGRPGRSVG